MRRYWSSSVHAAQSKALRESATTRDSLAIAAALGGSAGSAETLLTAGRDSVASAAIRVPDLEALAATRALCRSKTRRSLAHLDKTRRRRRIVTFSLFC